MKALTPHNGSCWVEGVPAVAGECWVLVMGGGEVCPSKVNPILVLCRNNPWGLVSGMGYSGQEEG